MSNDELYEKAMNAIQELYSDSTVSQAETKASLNSLIEIIEAMIDTLGEG